MDLDKKVVISMLSSADKVEGQGAGSTYLEQVNPARESANDLFTVEINNGKKADIIHSHTIDPQNYLKMKSNRDTNVHYVYFPPDTLNGSIQLSKALLSVFKKYMISFYKTADYLIVVNPIFMKELEKYGIVWEKMTCILNCVSKEQFHVKPVGQRSAVREQYGIKTGDSVIIGVGQIQTREGVLDFVDVVKKLPDVHFAWCGGFSFGEITDGYEGLKKVVGSLPTSVQSPGIIPRSDMNDIYNTADILFTLSHNELFPMAILETVSLHRPVVLRSLGLYKDISFKKYQMVDDNDSFAELIRRLRKDPAYYVRYAAGSTYISEYYPRESVLSIWKRFYTRVYEELRERKRGQRGATLALWQEGS